MSSSQSESRQPTRRHCMIVHAYYPIGEPRVQREAEALLQAGYSVDVICLRQPGEPARQVVNGAMVYRMPVRRHKGWGAALQLLEYLAFFFLAAWQVSWLHLKHRYPTVQAHNLPDFLIFSTLLPRLTGARTILDLHDLMPEFYASRFKQGMNSQAARLVIWQEQISCRFAQRVITVSEPWRQTLISRGVAAEKTHVVMNLADTRIFQSGNLPRPAPSPQELRLFYHGTLAQRYGIDLILQAVARLQGELPGLSLTIHGRGEFLETLQQLAGQLNLGDCVQFSSNYMPMEELPAFIARRAELGIVPYRRDIFTDGILPTKLMEYASLGIPAIVARTPAVSAYFTDQMVEFFTAENGDELADCIRRLYHDRRRLAELAHNVQQFNQLYNWEQQKEGYIQLVSTLGAG